MPQYLPTWEKVIQKKLALGNLAKLVFWSISSFKNWSYVKLPSFFVCQFLWWEEFWEIDRPFFQKNWAKVDWYNFSWLFQVQKTNTYLADKIGIPGTNIDALHITEAIGDWLTVALWENWRHHNLLSRFTDL